MFIQQEKNSPTSELTCAFLLSFLSVSSDCVTVVLMGLLCKAL